MFDIITLGIDSAWTIKEPSGVALLSSIDNSRTKIIHIGRSYEEFLRENVNLNNDRVDKYIEVPLKEVISHCVELGFTPKCIAVDMPISNKIITGRRTCESDISKKYGSKGASTHSPSIERPGIVSEKLFKELTGLGYKWATEGNRVEENSLIEVYPHTAIIEYLNLDYRYEYKVAKKSSYTAWKGLSNEEKNRKLIGNFNHLISQLSKAVINVYDFFPELHESQIYSMKYLKGVEDALDALICSLVGNDYLLNNTDAYGGSDGTIWVPKARNFT